MFSRNRRSGARQELPLAQSSSIRSLAYSSSLPSVASSSRTSIRHASSGQYLRRSARRQLQPLLQFLLVFITFVVICYELAGMRKPHTNYIPVQGNAIQSDYVYKYPTDSNEITSVKLIDGVPVHPVGEAVLTIIRTLRIKSLIDYPCRNHREITPGVMRLLITDVHYNASDFKFICVDTDSRQMALSHSALKKAFEDDPDAIPKSQYMRHSFERTFAFGLNSKNRPSADLFLSWNNGRERNTNVLRTLLLRARSAGVKFAILGGYPMIGMTEKIGSAWIDSSDSIQARPGSFDNAPFPFSEALLAIATRYDEHRSLLLYDLSVLPHAPVDAITMRDVVEQDIVFERTRRRFHSIS